MIQGAVDEKGVVALCRCFASSKFPLCNGAHNKHNEDHCDNAGPIVLKRLGGGAKVAPQGDKEDDLKDLKVCQGMSLGQRRMYLNLRLSIRLHDVRAQPCGAGHPHERDCQAQSRW